MWSYYIKLYVYHVQLRDYLSFIFKLYKVISVFIKTCDIKTRKYLLISKEDYDKFVQQNTHNIVFT